MFSFQLPWEKIQEKIRRLVSNQGEIDAWPLEPKIASQLVRVRLVQGPEDLLERVKHLKVRAEIVKRVAYLYIERHGDELRNLPRVSELLKAYSHFSIKACLKQHVLDRLQRFYPERLYPLHPTGNEGIIPEMAAVVQEQFDLQTRIGPRPQDGAFEMKHATMPDAPTTVVDAFAHKRPLMVADEATTEQALPHDVLLEYGLGTVAELKIPMSREFDDQWTSTYLPMVFPCALNYRCSGAGYQNCSATGII